ncbi:MAG TPA: hypothetical protein VFS43_36000 [Polyangiaceae bacterium]|nr:hypothetical protein [Polyangiaceae bacterium]
MREQEARFGDPACPPSKAEPGPLVVELTSPGPEWRGRLGRWIEHEVARALAAPNAPPARVSFEPEADPHTLVGRALSLGATSLVVRLGSLRAVATADGLLGVADSASLRRWAAASLERPLSLELSAADASILAYDAPRPLAELLGPEAPDAAPGPRSPRPSAPPPAAPSPHAASRAAAPPPPAAAPPPLASPREVPSAAASPPDAPPPAASPADEPATAAAPPAVAPAAASAVAPAASAAAPAATPGRAAAPRQASRPGGPGPAAAPAPRPVAVRAAPTRLFPGLDEAGCRACAAELEAARGPHSLAQIEQLFVRRYLPLAEAEAFGIADAQARRSRAQWAAAFSRTYTESFATFRPAGKRPTMVLDAPAIAGRAARLHGARTTQLVLVDALRFDLGLRVHKRLGELLRGHAVCAERAVLWSALPSTTPTQLALLARGPEGLALPPPEADEEPIINRGRGVDVPRRVKVGARDVLKLDLVEARLRDSAAPSGRLDEVAEEVAQAVAKCALSLPARTLLFVFGDHGFLLDEGEGRGERPDGAWQGGASPEEVLVPGFAYLTGGVH